MPDGQVGFATRRVVARADVGCAECGGVRSPEQGAEVLLNQPHGYRGPGPRTASSCSRPGVTTTPGSTCGRNRGGGRHTWLVTELHESQPELSPDGRCLYSSSEPGNGRSGSPVPRRQRTTEFLLKAGSRRSGRPMGASCSIAARMANSYPWLGRPRLFLGRRSCWRPVWMGSNVHVERNYDVAPDGRFLMLEAVEGDDPEPAHRGRRELAGRARAAGADRLRSAAQTSCAPSRRSARSRSVGYEGKAQATAVRPGLL